MRQTCLFGFVLLRFSLFAQVAWAEDGMWILVDTKKLQLEIKTGNKTLAVMENIAIGRNGAGLKQRRDDDVTPLGTFTIGWMNNNSPFYRFYGLTYPSAKNANEALLGGLLSKQAHTNIINAHKRNDIPPQHTTIGGQIGIHGLGNADKTIHKTMNWTHGCIALTNAQIDKLGQWISKGMTIKIK